MHPKLRALKIFEIYRHTFAFAHSHELMHPEQELVGRSHPIALATG